MALGLAFAGAFAATLGAGFGVVLGAGLAAAFVAGFVAGLVTAFAAGFAADLAAALTAGVGLLPTFFAGGLLGTAGLATGLLTRYSSPEQHDWKTSAAAAKHCSGQRPSIR
jgi:hypothetical protein